jgi:hypothetical protein
MHKHLLWMIFALMLTACGGCSAIDETGGDEVIEADSLVVGDRLPEFEITMNDGSVVRTADLLGQPSVVVLFSVDCPDCRHELPEIQRLWNMNQADSLIPGQRIVTPTSTPLLGQQDIIAPLNNVLDPSEIWLLRRVFKVLNSFCPDNEHDQKLIAEMERLIVKEFNDEI